MKLLSLHQNFPGQFRRLARSWARRPDWEVLGMGRSTAPGMQDVRWLGYKLARAPHSHQHPYLRQMEGAVLHGQAVIRALMALKRKGYRPDVVLAHPGWGETMFIRDVYPDARLVHHCEWFYATQGSDTGFDPEYPVEADLCAKLRTWNALHLLNLLQCDAGVSPTQWQRSRHPCELSKKIHVVHEGIDTELLAPDPCARLVLPNGLALKAGDPVITYVARNLEPYRGFHVFMRALEVIQQAHKSCHAVIIGGDDVSYGSKPRDAPNWRKKMLAEVKLDPTRTHFLGRVPYDVYRKALQVSCAHVYLTYPFVLSWSALEAMATGCLVIGSATPPVQEVIHHGFNGLLTDFFNTRELADKVVEGLVSQNQFAGLRLAARESVIERCSLAAGEAAYRAILEGHRPA